MNKYQVVKVLGDGSFGQVLLANIKNSNAYSIDTRQVAIKKMKRTFKDWEECLRLRELKTLKRLNHINIIKLREVIKEKNQLYFVFDYIRCGSLYDLILKHDHLDWNFSLVSIVSGSILDGLGYMHANGIFHRDLKPENILVDISGNRLHTMQVKIADFGLARFIGDSSPLTQYIATRWYRAPEIILKFQLYDQSIDIWAFGCILYEMVTLQPLFDAQTEIDMLHQICLKLGGPSALSEIDIQLKEVALLTMLQKKYPVKKQQADFSLQSHQIQQSIPPFKATASTELTRPPFSGFINSCLQSCIKWQPQERSSAQQLLRILMFKPFIFHKKQLSASNAHIPKELAKVSCNNQPVTKVLRDANPNRSVCEVPESPISLIERDAKAMDAENMGQIAPRRLFDKDQLRQLASKQQANTFNQDYLPTNASNSKLLIQSQAPYINSMHGNMLNVKNSREIGRLPARSTVRQTVYDSSNEIYALLNRGRSSVRR
ncbi:hypothetical protein MIR68_006587 [Amoeboaphelidium protococcarum]|nr:hypothetical protein MIR68_006587 [Amoeboaphelidium protococcarum]